MNRIDPIERVKRFVEQYHIEATVRVLPPETTKTSAMAAEMLGCSVAEIAKTIGFVDESSTVDSILVTLSGDRRVSLERLGELLNMSQANLRKMSAEQMKARTGYSIGGVPPFPHNPGVRVLADQSLFRFSRVWAAAGSNNSVMQIKPAVLTELLKLEAVDVSE